VAGAIVCPPAVLQAAVDVTGINVDVKVVAVVVGDNRRIPVQGRNEEDMTSFHGSAPENRMADVAGDRRIITAAVGSGQRIIQFPGFPGVATGLSERYRGSAPSTASGVLSTRRAEATTFTLPEKLATNVGFERSRFTDCSLPLTHLATLLMDSGSTNLP
jgi:hypothetical protein